MKVKINGILILIAALCITVCAALVSACTQTDGEDAGANPETEKTLYTVTVVYDDGSYANNVTVTVGGLTATTDGDGKAEFSLKPDYYSVAVSAPQGYRVDGSYSLTATTTEVTVTLKAEQTDLTYRITVRYSASSYAKGVEVVLNGEHRATTDDDGVAEFTLPAGEYSVTVNPPQGYSVSGSFTVHEEKLELTVTLVQSRISYSVTVLYPDGQPAAGVAVRAGTNFLTTNSQGKATFTATGSSYAVYVTSPEGYYTDDDFAVNSTDKDLVITLKELTPITYTVTVKFADGSAAQGATVDFGGEKTLTVGSGGIVSESLKSQTLTVTVSLDNYMTQIVKLSEENPSATVTLYSRISFSGGTGEKDTPYTLDVTEYGGVECAPQTEQSDSTAYYYYKVTSDTLSRLICAVLDEDNTALYLYSDSGYHQSLVGRSSELCYAMKANVSYYLLFMVNADTADPSFTLVVEEQPKVAVTLTVKTSDTNEAVSGLTISIFEYNIGGSSTVATYTAVTDANGECVLNVYPNTYTVKATGFPEGYSGLATDGTVITIGATDTELNTFVKVNSQVCVYVYKDNTSNPAVGITAVIKDGNGTFLGSSLTDENGRADFLMPNDAGSIFISFENLPDGYYGTGDGRLVVLPCSIILVPAQNYSVTVKGDGALLSGVKVSLVQDDTAVYQSVTGANGVALFEGVDPTYYELVIENYPEGLHIINDTDFVWSTNSYAINLFSYDYELQSSGGLLQPAFTVQTGNSLCYTECSNAQASNYIRLYFTPTEAGTYVLKCNDEDYISVRSVSSSYEYESVLGGLTFTVTEEDAGKRVSLLLNCPPSSTGVGSGKPYYFTVTCEKV